MRNKFSEKPDLEHDATTSDHQDKCHDDHDQHEQPGGHNHHELCDHHPHGEQHQHHHFFQEGSLITIPLPGL